MHADAPIYVSKPSAKNLWREYRLYADRLELDTIPWGLVRVPLSDLRSVSVRPPLVVFDVVRGDYGVKEMLKTVKLDWADLNEHVVLEKSGFWKQFRLTPDDPQAFKEAVERALAAAREE